MSDALGLSIGTTNLVAVRPGRQPLIRRSVLTLWDDRPAEVGVPSQNPELTSPNLTQVGLVLRGFVERVGDPVPLVAADGSTHRGEALVAAALDAMARAAEDGIPPAAVAVTAPAHWGPAAIGALRGALRGSPVLSAGGFPPIIVSDATAALAALQATPGLPGSGVVALCDFGGSGTSITLADAGANLTPIGETIRIADFSGDRIDRDLLDQVLAGIGTAGQEDTGRTTAIGALTRLREECRLAKERLSAETATTLPVDLATYRTDIRLTRAELDAVIAEPFNGFLDALGDALERNRIPAVNLTAIATVGGGAAIPFVGQRLADALRVPVITTPYPGAAAAVGAAMLASRGPILDAPTGIATTAADAPTGLAPTAWASGTAGQAATESASDGSPSATFRALAWSQDEDAGGEPVPYTGADYTATPPTDPGPLADIEHDDAETVVVAAPLPWYSRPPLLLGLAAAVAALAVGGLAITLTGNESSPTTTTTRVTKPGEQPTNPAVPQTITITGGNGQPTVSTITPTTTAAPATTSTTTTTPTTTTTTSTTTTTTTTTPTTTTTTTTTPTTTTTTTTTPTTTTTTARTTTTTAPTTVPPTTAEPVPPTTAEPVPPTAEPAVTTQAIIPEEPLPETKPAPEE